MKINKRESITLLIGFICFFILAVLLVKTNINLPQNYHRGQIEAVTTAVKSDEPKSEYLGEKIIYEIKMGLLKVGMATYDNVSFEDLGGKKVSHINFETRLTKFYDLEKIYSDPVSFLPLRVERKINIWPRHEEIVEIYDQDNFTLEITKTEGKNKTKSNIKKNGFIHNSILLPFFLRRMPDLQIGWSLKANLPTQVFEIKLVSKQEIEVPAGKFKTFYFESIPEKFQIWISDDQRRIPVKIKGTGAIGYTMLMKEYRR